MGMHEYVASCIDLYQTDLFYWCYLGWKISRLGTLLIESNGPCNDSFLPNQKSMCSTEPIPLPSPSPTPHGLSTKCRWYKQEIRAAAASFAPPLNRTPPSLFSLPLFDFLLL